ncbi:MAG: YHS domain-containing (seleno)protein [Rhodospirillaceae bacterium]
MSALPPMSLSKTLLSKARLSVFAAALLGGGLVMAVDGVQPAMAFQQNVASEVNVDADGLALRGYDPVAYFTLGAPTEGDPAITATHNGATYRFANAEHLAKFSADPDKYAPAYGGYCAIGTSFGRKFDGDPKLWDIADGKLYLNVAEGPHNRYLAEKAQVIPRADSKWDAIKAKAPSDLN